MQIVTSPWRAEFNAFVDSAKNTIRVVSPFYSFELVTELLRTSDRQKKFFLFALEERAVKGNFQSVSAIRAILKDRNAEVRFIKNLHAKFLVADEKLAIVTSANLTGGGLDSNVEVGVRFDDRESVKRLVVHFDGLWDKAHTITSKELEDYDAFASAKRTGDKFGKAHGPNVQLNKLPKRPPTPGTPALGWIIVHSEEAYRKEGVWESPIKQLEKVWSAKKGEQDWGWTSPKMNANPVPRRVLLAWKGEVFGHAVATVRAASQKEIAAGSLYFFVLTNFQWAKRVSFEKLPLGRRRRHHRGLIRLNEKILETYWKLAK